MIVQKIKKRVLFEFKTLDIVMLEDKTMWHTKRNKIINKRLNCRSLGYWVERRFYTTSKLNKLAFKSKLEIVVNETIDYPF